MTVKTLMNFKLRSIVQTGSTAGNRRLAQCKKTTTVNKMNDRNNMPTAHSGTFACPYTQATASQAKEPEFFPTHRINK